MLSLGTGGLNSLLHLINVLFLLDHMDLDVRIEKESKAVHDKLIQSIAQERAKVCLMLTTFHTHILTLTYTHTHTRIYTH